MTSVKKVTPGGYMTVYLALTVTVIMALCLALIEGCRYRGISLETECVMDIGMDSILWQTDCTVCHRLLLRDRKCFDKADGESFAGVYEP